MSYLYMVDGSLHWLQLGCQFFCLNHLHWQCRSCNIVGLRCIHYSSSWPLMEWSTLWISCSFCSTIAIFSMDPFLALNELWTNGYVVVPSVRFISYASYPRVYGLMVLQIIRESIPFRVFYAFNIWCGYNGIFFPPCLMTLFDSFHNTLCVSE